MLVAAEDKRKKELLASNVKQANKQVGTKAGMLGMWPGPLPVGVRVRVWPRLTVRPPRLPEPLRSVGGNKENY